MTPRPGDEGGDWANLEQILKAGDPPPHRFLIWAGQVFRILVYCAILGLLWLFAPANIGDIPLSQLTINSIIVTLCFIAAALWVVRLLFSPSQDLEQRAAWGWLAFLTGVGLFVFFIWSNF